MNTKQPQQNTFWIKIFIAYVLVLVIWQLIEHKRGGVAVVSLVKTGDIINDY